MPKEAEGGYILLHRAVFESDLMDKPPHFRDIFYYLLLKAAWRDCQRKGVKLKRGQLVTSYKEIIADLTWFVGKRKMTYKKHHIDHCFRYLKREDMITTQKTTTKTTRRLLITIINYNKYQSIEMSERDTERDTERDKGVDSPIYILKRKKEYSELDFPNEGFKHKFAVWELSRNGNKHAPKMTAQNRKTQLTHLLNAMQRPEAMKGIGYRSMFELLDHAAENKWRGFAWLKTKLNKWEDNQKRYAKQRAGDDAPTLPNVEDVIK